MKTYINIPQAIVIQKGYDLSISDIALLDVLYHIGSSPNIYVLIRGGKTYLNVTHRMIKERLPLLKIAKDTLYRKMKNLVELGFLDKINEGHKNGKPYYRTTLKTESLYRDV